MVFEAIISMVSSLFFKTSPTVRELIPPSSGEVPGNVPSNNAAYGIYPKPPRNPFVMRKPVAGIRNQDFHPYRRMEEKPRPSVLEPSKGSLLFDSLKELRSMLPDHKVKYYPSNMSKEKKYPSNMRDSLMNMNNGVHQTIKGEANYTGLFWNTRMFRNSMG